MSNMLYSNKLYFEGCIRIAERLFHEKLYEECICYIEKTAFFAWFNFSGYYKSRELELILANIQEKILPPFPAEKERNSTGKVLHICSELYTSGGHTKLLYTWIKNDRSKKHTILSTRQSQKELQDMSLFYLPDFPELDCLSAKAPTKTESAQLLQNHLMKDYDVILLHIHPDETVANIVLSQENINIPVCFINHADHTFWLGTAVSDMVLQIRESSIAFDTERRGISVERQFFLPIPIESAPDKNDEPVQDSSNTIRLLSTGAAYKYDPNEHYNFLQEAYRIVEENPQVVFNIVGIDQDSEYGKQYSHERIILHGTVSASALADIEKTTDIYIEGFPMASFTALLQTSLRKIPFLLHYSPLPLFTLFSEGADDTIAYPQDLETWRQRVQRLITDQPYRIETGEKQYAYIRNNFSIEVWKSRIKELYRITDILTHSFRQPGADIWYHGENEKLLVTIDKRKHLPHFSLTGKLSLRSKYLVYQLSKIKNSNVTYLNKKKLLKYFFRKK